MTTKHAWLLAMGLLGALPLACETTYVSPTGPGYYSGGVGGGSGGGGVGGVDQCNPVTNDGCPSDGSSCDVGPNGSFQCYPPPNTVDVCGQCDGQTTTCAAEETCVVPNGGESGTCYRYCCTDADCGAGGLCDTVFGATVLNVANHRDAVGLCVTDSSSENPTCGTASPTSGGTCVGGYTPSGTGGGSTSSSGGMGGSGTSSSGGMGGHSGTSSSGGMGGHSGSSSTGGASSANGSSSTSGSSGSSSSGGTGGAPADGGAP